MKRISRRSLPLWALLIAFISGISFLVYSLGVNADSWVMMRNNKHLFSNGQLVNGGTVYDRDGVVLVNSVNGSRVYNSDSTIRKATLHAVGDPYGSIATGVQTIYNSQLTGYSFASGVYSMKQNGKGNDITLTLDSRACATAYKAMNGRKGTVGVYNYKTGEILCMVSTPSYDVNDIPKDLETNEDYSGAYVNRLLKGVYTPGSTFKTVVALCAIENMPDLFSRTWECEGKYNTGDGTIICNATHHTIDFDNAFAQSCNSAFAQIAIELGAAKLTQTVEKLGLTGVSSMDGISGASGNFKLSDEDKALLGWCGIGQGDITVNPLQMMKIMGAAGNGGKCVEPTLIKKVSGSLLSAFPSKPQSVDMINSNTCEIFTKSMRNNVETNYGEKNYSGLNLCAKSGTAQIDGKDSTAWFVGYMNDENNPYAFVVAIEEGGSGSAVAGPVAGKVLKAIVANND